MISLLPLETGTDIRLLSSGKVVKLCNVEVEFDFVLEYSKLLNLQNELFFIITKTDPICMHLDIL